MKVRGATVQSEEVGHTCSFSMVLAVAAIMLLASSVFLRLMKMVPPSQHTRPMAPVNHSSLLATDTQRLGMISTIPATAKDSCFYWAHRSLSIVGSHTDVVPVGSVLDPGWANALVNAERWEWRATHHFLIVNSTKVKSWSNNFDWLLQCGVHLFILCDRRQSALTMFNKFLNLHYVITWYYEQLM